MNNTIGKITATNVNFYENKQAQEDVTPKINIKERVYQIWGNKDFGQIDYQQLLISNVPVKILASGEFEYLKRDNQIYRESLSLPKYWHFSSHSSDSTIEFQDKQVEWFQLLDIFQTGDALDTVFFNSCQSASFMYKFKPYFKNCVGYLHDIENNDASKLTSLFWKNFMELSFDETIEKIRQDSPLLFSSLIYL